MTTTHDTPLKPGEIRIHTTRGGKGFRVMHTGNGAFTQARGPEGVICTLMSEHAALEAYAAAIEAAEALEIAVDDIVVRRGEENGPRGEVLEAHDVTEYGAGGSDTGRFLLVSFSGMSPVALDARAVRRVEPAEDAGLDALLADELARPLRDAVRRYVPGGGAQFLDALVERAEDAAILAERVKALCDRAESATPGAITAAEHWTVLEDLIQGLREAIGETR